MELHQAVLNRQEDSVTGCLERGFDPNALDAHGNGALHLAAAIGETGLMYGLLAKGAHPNLLTHLSQTPLHFAALYDQIDAANYLMQAGADPSLQDGAGRTAWAIATQKGYEDLAALIVPPPAPELTWALPQGSAEPPIDVASPEEEPEEGKKKKSKVKKPAKHKPIPRRIAEMVLLLALLITAGFHGWAFQVQQMYAKRTKDAQVAVEAANKLAKELGDESFALQDYLNAINIDPDYAEAYFKASTAYSLMAAYDDAIAYQKQGQEAQARLAERANITKLAFSLFKSILPFKAKAEPVPPNKPLGGAPAAIPPPAPAPAPEPAATSASVSTSAPISPSEPTPATTPSAPLSP